MVKELIRDSATSKLQRDSTTGKLQRAAGFTTDCEFCAPGATPSKITFTLSGLSDCACFLIGSDSYRAIGTAAILNNTSFVLKQFGWDGEFGDQPCVWAKAFGDAYYRVPGGYFGTLRAYWTSDCTGAYLEFPIEYLALYVEKTAAGSLIISAALGADTGSSQVLWFNAYVYATWNGFAWIGKAATITNCIAVSSLANVLDCSGAVQGEACGSGLATVVEGSTTQTWFQLGIPNGDESVQWSPSSDNYKQVNDPYGAPDDDSSYNYTNVGSYKDYFNFHTFVVPAGSTITNVQVFGRGKLMQAGGALHVRALIRVGGTTYYGSGEQLYIGGYVNYTATWTVNPKTGLAWTVDEVNGIGSNALQQLGYEYLGYQRTSRITQTYTKVNYTKVW